jgi:hypothetical protein
MPGKQRKDIFHRKSSVSFQRLVTRGSVIWKFSWSSPNGRCTCRLQVTLLRMTCSAGNLAEGSTEFERGLPLRRTLCKFARSMGENSHSMWAARSPVDARQSGPPRFGNPYPPRVSHGISEHLPMAHANLHIYTFRRHESSQDSSASFFSSFGTYSLILRKLSAYCISRPFFSLASFAVPANHSFIMSSK